MALRRPSAWWLGFFLGLLSVQCGSRELSELRRLEKEKEELQARLEQLERENRLLRGQPGTAVEVRQHFAEDSTRGTLAGMLPGDEVPQARFRFGQENRIRTWSSEGRILFQYEWALLGGVMLRMNADGNGRIEKISVLLDNTSAVDIPSLAGVRLGQETFTSIQKKFGNTLITARQLWGAQGLYTVSQSTPVPGSTGRWLEFVYQMPEGVSPAQLDQIGEALARQSDPAIVESYLRDRTPFSIALAEAR